MIYSTFYTENAFIFFEKQKQTPNEKHPPKKPPKQQPKKPKLVSRMLNSFKFIFPQNLVPWFIIYLIKLMPLTNILKMVLMIRRDWHICLLQSVMTYAKKKTKYAEKLMQQWNSENQREKSSLKSKAKGVEKMKDGVAHRWFI